MPEMSGVLELELWVAVSFWTCVLGTELGSSAKAAWGSHCQSISPAPFYTVYIFIYTGGVLYLTEDHTASSYASQSWSINTGEVSQELWDCSGGYGAPPAEEVHQTSIKGHGYVQLT